MQVKPAASRMVSYGVRFSGTIFPPHLGQHDQSSPCGASGLQLQRTQKYPAEFFMTWQVFGFGF